MSNNVIADEIVRQLYSSFDDATLLQVRKVGESAPADIPEVRLMNAALDREIERRKVARCEHSS